MVTVWGAIVGISAAFAALFGWKKATVWANANQIKKLWEHVEASELEAHNLRKSYDEIRREKESQDRTIALQNQTIAEQNSTIAGLNATNATQNTELQQLRRENAELRIEIARLVVHEARGTLIGSSLLATEEKYLKEHGQE